MNNVWFQTPVSYVFVCVCMFKHTSKFLRLYVNHIPCAKKNQYGTCAVVSNLVQSDRLKECRGVLLGRLRSGGDCIRIS